MLEQWVYVSATQLVMIFLSSLAVYSAILVYTQIVGLRSFSKMSASDFAMTIAIGSLFGATISSPNPTLLAGLFAIACLFGMKWAFATARRASDRISKAVDNQPIVLMASNRILHENLRRANVTEHDLFGKLREANAVNFNQILAVVFETTGDVSVLHCSDQSTELDRRLFEGVIGAEHLFQRGGSEDDAHSQAKCA